MSNGIRVFVYETVLILLNSPKRCNEYGWQTCTDGGTTTQFRMEMAFQK
jgi:hypothetical protein